MYNYKYKKILKYKTLKKEDIIALSNIIEKIGGITVEEIKIYRQIKRNGTVEVDKNEFISFGDFIEYINKDIKYLDYICFSFMSEEKELFDLEYNRYFFRWEITYNKSTKTIDSFIFNMKEIFKVSVLDWYKKIRWLIFAILYGIEIVLVFIIKIKNKYVTAFCIFNFIVMIINSFMECKPYRDNSYLKQNKDNIIFYILGVATPYIINFILKLLK